MCPGWVVSSDSSSVNLKRTGAHVPYHKKPRMGPVAVYWMAVSKRGRLLPDVEEEEEEAVSEVGDAGRPDHRTRCRRRRPPPSVTRRVRGGYIITAVWAAAVFYAWAVVKIKRRGP